MILRAGFKDLQTLNPKPTGVGRFGLRVASLKAFGSSGRGARRRSPSKAGEWELAPQPG